MHQYSCASLRADVIFLFQVLIPAVVQK